MKWRRVRWVGVRMQDLNSNQYSKKMTRALKALKPKCTRQFYLLLSFFLLVNNIGFGQQDSTAQISYVQPLYPISSTHGVLYTAPVHDFIVFNDEAKDDLLIGDVDTAKLNELARFAICCMGSVPPIRVQYFHEGYTTGAIQVGNTDFVTVKLPVIFRTDTFDNLGDYEQKRKQLQESKHSYIIEERTIGYNKIVDIILPNEDYPNELRFYEKLRNMFHKLHKGEYADYYFEDFETFENSNTGYNYVTPEGKQLYKLRFYYLYFPNDIEGGKVFTSKDSRAIIGRDYILKISEHNERYVLSWYAF